MAIIYSDTEPRRGGGAVRIADMDPIRQYRRHYGNWLFLSFLANRSQDAVERHQARQEIVICERKIAFWRRHPQWNAEEGARVAAELKAQWWEG